MPSFNAKCDNCKVKFRAHVYGYRSQRIAYCPECGESCKSYRKNPEDYRHLVFVRYDKETKRNIWKDLS